MSACAARASELLFVVRVLYCIVLYVLPDPHRDALSVPARTDQILKFGGEYNQKSEKRIYDALASVARPGYPMGASKSTTVT